MSTPAALPIVDLPALRERLAVFRDRAEAGAVLADLLREFRSSGALVLAIPAGGVPVAAQVASRLRLPLDVAVTSKLLLPGTTEAGYGAVAWDGTVVLNEALVTAYRLDEAQIGQDLALTREKVARRAGHLRRGRPPLQVQGRTVILVDDGLASGYTLRAAALALREAGAARVVVAVPTAHTESARQLRGLAEALYCPNLRSGLRYAVADAYQRWRDVKEEEAAQILAQFEEAAGEGEAS